jgi:hypothetical protein
MAECVPARLSGRSALKKHPRSRRKVFAAGDDRRPSRAVASWHRYRGITPASGITPRVCTTIPHRAAATPRPASAAAPRARRAALLGFDRRHRARRRAR